MEALPKERQTLTKSSKSVNPRGSRVSNIPPPGKHKKNKSENHPNEKASLPASPKMKLKKSFSLGRSGKGGIKKFNSMRDKEQYYSGAAGFSAVIRRINIMDLATGITLYEKIWQWRGAEAPAGLDALVATFKQFAASISKTSDDVTRVRFELPPEMRQKKRATIRNAHKQLRLQSTLPPQEVMELLVHSNYTFKAVLFHNITQGSHKLSSEILENVLEAFTAKFRGIIEDEKMKQRLKVMFETSGGADPEEQARLMVMFSSFDIDTVIDRTFEMDVTPSLAAFSQSTENKLYVEKKEKKSTSSISSSGVDIEVK